MGYSAAVLKRTPRTYQACERLWTDRSTTVNRHGRLTLGHNTYLRRRDDGTFEATYHDNVIVRYHPDHKVIDACGYSRAPTTQARISALANVHMHSDSSLGFTQNIRVNGYPYFDGMRIDNHGYILPEDIRPDTKRVERKEVQLQYTRLFRWLDKVLLARYELGEFETAPAHTSTPINRGVNALLDLDSVRLQGGSFPSAAMVCDLLWSSPGIYTEAGRYKRDSSTPPAPLRAVLADLRAAYRKNYFRHHDGYETIEVK